MVSNNENDYMNEIALELDNKSRNEVQTDKKKIERKVEVMVDENG